MQWWIQIGLLGLFGWTLIRAHVSKEAVARVFVVSLLPVALFGCWQFAVQHVDAMKWLGVAAQDPRTLGVAVVETIDFRVLRVYGSFPHPNIFGGWLAIGFVVSVWLASRASRKLFAIGWSLASTLLAVALLLTFARGAWIAAIVGIFLVLIRMWTMRVGATRRVAPTDALSIQYAAITLLCSAIIVGVIGYEQRVFVFSRVEAQGRLETKSFDERTQSLKDGVSIFLKHPIFGSGPNAEMLELNQKTSVPLQPPHDVFLLSLDDFGIAGVVLLGWLLIRYRNFVKSRFLSGYWILIPLCLLGLFDHYPMSLWAGESLVFVTFLLA